MEAAEEEQEVAGDVNVDLSEIEPSQKVWVGNLPAEASAQALLALFNQLTTPTHAQVFKAGHGCVIYASSDEAATGVSIFDGSTLDGATLQCDMWTRKDRMSGHNVKSKGDDSGKGWGKSRGMAKGMFLNPWSSWSCGSLGPAGRGWGPGAGFDDISGGEERSFPGVAWLTVAEDSSLRLQGLPACGPAVVWEKGFSLFSAASAILSEIVEVSSNVTVIHDPDWWQFPEVGVAIKQAIGEEQCFAVAISKLHQRWAVSAAAGWKNRETSVKLALAAALAIEDRMLLQRLTEQRPTFSAFCSSIISGTSIVGHGEGHTNGAPSWRGRGNCAAASGKTCANFGAKWGGHGSATASDSAPKGGSGWHPVPGAAAPVVHFARIGSRSKLMQQGFGPEAPAVVHRGKNDKQHFMNAHSILGSLIADPSTVVYEDDPDWLHYPEVGEALRAAGAQAPPFCVASCTEQACWAVGIGSGWKYRESAAKMALALSIAATYGKMSEIAANFPEFAGLCAGAGLVAPDPQAPASLGSLI